MKRLINDLQLAAQIEIGKLSIRQVDLSVDLLISQVIALLEPLVKEKSIELKCQITEDLPHLWVDSERIIQVFSNLIGNSIKFTPSGGTITLRGKMIEDRVQFSISDTGPGISKQKIPKVFDKYWQAEKIGKGMGPGLSIAKEIIEAHGGKIWVEPNDGQGITFCFTIPTADSHSKKGKAA